MMPFKLCGRSLASVLAHLPVSSMYLSLAVGMEHQGNYMRQGVIKHQSLWSLYRATQEGRSQSRLSSDSGAIRAAVLVELRDRRKYFLP